ncbi:hypothetical protein ACHAWF_005240 [Thalassiosira exigua]
MNKMANVFYTKKAKSKMRARQRRKAKAVGDGDGSDGGGSGGGDGSGDPDAASSGGRGSDGGLDGGGPRMTTSGSRKRAAAGELSLSDDHGGVEAPSDARKKARVGERATTTIEVPAGLTSKEAKKFRKDERRRARVSGTPEDSIRFVVEGQKPVKEEGAPGVDGESKTGNGEAKKRPPKRQFPRINDLLSEHAARARLDEERAKRKAVDDVLPPSETGRYVAVDCEMVGVGSDGRRSALARASAVDWDGNVLLDAFVRVPERVTDFRTRVSGVRPKDIDARNEGAMDPDEARDAVGKLLEGRVLVGHALKNDLAALMLSHPRSEVRDTARYKPFMRATGRSGGKLRPRKLRDLVREHVGKRIQEEGQAHCSVDDARANMELFRCVRAPWEKELTQKAKGVKGKK